MLRLLHDIVHYKDVLNFIIIYNNFLKVTDFVYYFKTYFLKKKC